jgi:hypothetical protein
MADESINGPIALTAQHIRFLHHTMKEHKGEDILFLAWYEEGEEDGTEVFQVEVHKSA